MHSKNLHILGQHFSAPSFQYFLKRKPICNQTNWRFPNADSAGGGSKRGIRRCGENFYLYRRALPIFNSFYLKNSCNILQISPIDDEDDAVDK